jgi:hypothetical protein
VSQLYAICAQPTTVFVVEVHEQLISPAEAVAALDG